MKITNLPLTEKEKKSCYKQKLFLYVKINVIIVLKYIGKFEIMIIVLGNTGVLHILYAI